MNGRTFSQNPCKQGQSHHHHHHPLTEGGLVYLLKEESDYVPIHRGLTVYPLKVEACSVPVIRGRFTRFTLKEGAFGVPIEKKTKKNIPLVPVDHGKIQSAVCGQSLS